MRGLCSEAAMSPHRHRRKAVERVGQVRGHADTFDARFGKEGAQAVEGCAARVVRHPGLEAHRDDEVWRLGEQGLSLSHAEPRRPTSMMGSTKRSSTRLPSAVASKGLRTTKPQMDLTRLTLRSKSWSRRALTTLPRTSTACPSILGSPPRGRRA